MPPLIKLNRYIVALLASGLLVGTASAQTSAEMRHIERHARLAQKRNHIELLFFQHANTGTLQPSLQQQGCYKITLQGLDPYALYFANFPDRLAGKISVKNLLTIWNGDYKLYKITPNAIIHASTAADGKKDINDIVQLSTPAYDYTAKAMTYNACPLHAHVQYKATSLTDVSVFIDPFHRFPP